MVFVAEASRVYVPVDGKRKASSPLQRLTNVADNGAASLLLDHYAEDWRQLWWVRVDGEAELLQDDGALIESMARRLASKYPQYASVPMFAGAPTLLTLRCDRATAWSEAGSLAPIRQVI